jgi:hypothetical protein
LIKVKFDAGEADGSDAGLGGENRMRYHLGLAAVVAVLSSAAQAATFPDYAPDGKMWMSCFVRLTDTQYGAKDPIALGGYWLIDVPEGTRTETVDRLKAQWLDEYLDRIPTEFPGFVPRTVNGQVYDARCGSYYDRSDWAAYTAHVKEPVTSQSVFRSDFVPSFAEAWISTREHARDYTGDVAYSGNIKPSKPVVRKPSEPAAELNIVAPGGGSSSKANAAEEAELARKTAREQREAEFQAKLAEHDAEVADYQRKVAEREAEIARQKQQQAAAADAAAREIASYRSKMEDHRAQMAQADRQLATYDAAKRRYALCTSGDSKACADIAAGKPVAETQVADAGKASTDSDATRCVSNPQVGPSGTWKDAIAATVVNGCPTAVDVRICLMREGGWNCGVNWGLEPQEKWAWSSFKSDGQLFWDARVAGSNRPLASPE